MANLIIKSSADNLVLQGSDASPAITVGATGTTTFAENATLSGTANNLGTVTAGTYKGIVHSDATFPTGHVLQMFNVLSTAATSITNTNAVILTKTFNRIKGNSHFIVNTVVSMAMVTSNANTDGCDPDLRFFVNGSAVTTNGLLTGDGFYRSDVPAWRLAATNSGAYDVYQQGITQDFTHISSGSDNDSVTIAVDCTGSSLGVWINRSQASATSGGSSSLTIWEVSA